MKLTRNLKIFIGIYVVLTALFYWLSVINDVGVQTTHNNDGTITVVSSMPFLWFIIMIISMVVLYKTDDRRSSRRNLAFDYHLIGTILFVSTLLVVAVVYRVGFDAPGIALLLSTILFITSLFAHWIAQRRNPKGIEKAFK